MIQALLRGDYTHAAAFGIYTVVALVVIFGLRRIEASWAFVSSDDASRESRQAVTLAQAVWGFLKFRRIALLIVGAVASWFCRILLAGWTIWDAAIIVGTFAVWPFQEWFLHAYLLHLKPFRLLGRDIEPVFVKTHRMHHVNPWDPGSGVVALYFVVLYLLGLPLIWHFGLPLPQAMSGIASSLLLVLTYEWVHYLIHTTYKPKGAWYESLWRNHRLHHFKSEHHWYGVTTITADIVMGTHPPQESVANSDTCRTLGSQDERDRSVHATSKRSATGDRGSAEISAESPIQ